MNLTVTGPEASGYLTAYPCDATQPLASNVNFVAGQTVPNLVVARLDSSGRLCIYASAKTHVIADVAGAYATTGSYYNPLTPIRYVDTRDGTGGRTGKLGAGESIPIQVTGRFALPAGATSVVANVTVTEPESEGYLTVYPCDTSPPLASNLNYVAGQTVPNLVNVRLDAQGRVCVYSLRPTHVVVDVDGLYYPNAGYRYTPMTPVRVVDTRTGGSKLPAGQWKLSGFSGVPANATGLVANFTVTEPEAGGYLTVYPCGDPPTASNLNFVAGQTVPNLVHTGVDATGAVCVKNIAATHLVVDLAGYFAP